MKLQYRGSVRRRWGVVASWHQEQSWCCLGCGLCVQPPAQGSVKEVALISYCCQEVFYLFSASSRSLVLAGQAREGLDLLFSFRAAWLILSTLFRTLIIFNREGLIDFFFSSENGGLLVLPAVWISWFLSGLEIGIFHYLLEGTDSLTQESTDLGWLRIKNESVMPYSVKFYFFFYIQN